MSINLDGKKKSEQNIMNSLEILSNKEYEQYFKLELEKYKHTIVFKDKLGYELFRRIIDVLFCIIIIVPISILTVIISIIIILDSPGNPIFSQYRVGKNGKIFKIHKLRSMRTDAEQFGQKWAEENDPRITKVGKFLRKYRIDEIPQFYDILLGNLTLIGPRPEVPLLTKKFNEETPGFVTRLMVRPGLSGYAQINGGYNISYIQKWEKDNYFIENRNILLYFKIFVGTISVVLTGEDAK